MNTIIFGLVQVVLNINNSDCIKYNCSSRRLIHICKLCELEFNYLIKYKDNFYCVDCAEVKRILEAWS